MMIHVPFDCVKIILVLLFELKGKDMYLYEKPHQRIQSESNMARLLALYFHGFEILEFWFFLLVQFHFCFFLWLLVFQITY